MKVNLFKTQFGVLIAGALYAFVSILFDIKHFITEADTLFLLRYGKLPNPVITPCFWGGLCFIVCVYLAKRLLQTENLKTQKVLTSLTAFGTVFAWSVFSNSVYKYFVSIKEGVSFVSCTGVIAKNPFYTPCFYGATFFTLGFIFSLITYKKLKARVESVVE